jgi:hypothetical protein
MRFAIFERPYYPALFAVYPALFVFGQNPGQQYASELWRPIALNLFFAASIWLIAQRMLGDSRRAAMVAGLYVGFGHAFGLIAESSVQPLSSVLGMSAGAVKLALWAIALEAATIGVIAGSRGREALLSSITPGLNATAIVLVALALAGIQARPTVLDPEPEALERLGRESRPDIYYIVLDGYGDSEILREIYGVDNRPLLRALEARGFYVAKDSYANYLHTIQSLASSLNMTYLRPTSARDARHSRDPMPLLDAIRGNRVMSVLEKHGYDVYSFESGYGATDLRDSPRFVSSDSGLSEFENTLLNLTPIPVILSLVRAPDLYELHRRRIRYTLDQLPKLSRETGPKLVFAHIIAPHPPFVFDSRGEPAANQLPFKFYDARHFISRQSRAEYIAGYAAQASFIGDAILQSIDGIIKASEAMPVIILQGDHGPGVGFDPASYRGSDVIERGFILNAYLLPSEAARERLYPTITPINSFRLVLGQLLGEDLPLLEDRSFYNPEGLPYDFVEITTRLERAIESRSDLDENVER